MVIKTFGKGTENIKMNREKSNSAIYGKSVEKEIKTIRIVYFLYNFLIFTFF